MAMLDEANREVVNLAEARYSIFGRIKMVELTHKIANEDLLCDRDEWGVSDVRISAFGDLRRKVSGAISQLAVANRIPVDLKILVHNGIGAIRGVRIFSCPDNY